MRNLATLLTAIAALGAMLALVAAPALWTETAHAQGYPGRGPGGGMYYQDADQDGVCDWYPAARGPRGRLGRGAGMGPRGGKGPGAGPFYEDADQDGICDNFPEGPGAQAALEDVPGRRMGMSPLMQDVRRLAAGHQSIQRTVEKTDDGVRTVTTTSDSELLPVVRRHPREMRDYLASGGALRMWDPLFAELVRQFPKIDMDIQDVKNGVEVTATSDDAEVVKLIQAHADKVSKFVTEGPAAMRETTPLPDTYDGDVNADLRPGRMGPGYGQGAPGPGRGYGRGKGPRGSGPRGNWGQGPRGR